MGWMVPISLLAAMMLMSVVSGRMAFLSASMSHHAVLVHRQIGHFKAFLFQLLAGVQDGVMLEWRR